MIFQSLLRITMSLAHATWYLLPRCNLITGTLVRTTGRCAVGKWGGVAAFASSLGCTCVKHEKIV